MSSDRIYPLECDICAKSFSGQEPAKQHFKSASHKDKENLLARRPNMIDKHLICAVCNIKVNSLDTLNDHLQSPRHKAIQEKKQELSGGGKVVNASKPTQDYDIPDNISWNNSNSQKEYDFNGRRGICYVCNLELSSEQHAQQHLNGEKHRKAKLRKESTEPLHCNACNVSFSSQFNMEQHLAGKKHKKNQAEMTSQLNCGTYVLPGNQQTNRDGMMSPRGGMMLPPDRIMSPSCGMMSPQGGMMSPQGGMMLPQVRMMSPLGQTMSPQGGMMSPPGEMMSPQGGMITPPGWMLSPIDGMMQTTSPEVLMKNKNPINGSNLDDACVYPRVNLNIPVNNAPSQSRDLTPDYIFDGHRGRCYVCDIELTSSMHAEQHLSGIKHKKACDRKHAEIELCDANIEKNVDDAESKVPTTEYQWTVNGTRGFCNICNLGLTSRQHAEQHFSGAKHHKAKQIWMAKLKGEVFTIDKTKWLTCDVCHCKVNSQDQLVLHMGSHGRQVVTNQDTPTRLAVTDPPKNITQNNPLEYQKPVGDKELDKLLYDNNEGLSSINLSQNGFQAEVASITATFDSLWTTSSNGCGESYAQSLKSNNDMNETQVKIAHSSLSGMYSPQKHNNDINSTAEIDSRVDKVPVKINFNEVIKNVSPSVDGRDKIVNIQNYEANNNQPIPGIDPLLMLSPLTPTALTQIQMREKIVVEVTTDDPTARVIKPVSNNSTPSSSGHKNHRNTQGSELARATKNHSRGSRKSKSNGETVRDEDEDDTSSDDDSFHTCRDSTSNTLLSNPESNSDTNISNTSSKHSPYRYNCGVCNRVMDTKKALEEHKKGRYHQQKVSNENAVKRNHPKIEKHVVSGFEDKMYTLTTDDPRAYQCELFEKIMRDDTICFLPTGTGKTLVACMAVSAMLEMNPTRQVLFVVNKVLLVIQQSNYLIKQIANRKYKRFDPENPAESVDRNLRIAALCSGQQSTGGVPLWKHDVIVLTAAFCENLFNRGILRWEDQCLVVFDESHHCMKNHPYNNLLKDLHCSTSQELRCKTLGLTASPAGKSNLPMTISMLQQLQINMGGAHIAVVEKNGRELRIFQSNAQIFVKTQAYSQKESQFCQALQFYLLNCYMRLVAETDFAEKVSLGITATRSKMSTEELRKYAPELCGDILEVLESTIHEALPVNQAQAGEVQQLVSHIRYLCMSINVLHELGIHQAVEELQQLMATGFNTGFEFAKQSSLPCEELLQTIETLMSVEVVTDPLVRSGEDAISSRVSCLISELTSGERIKWNSGTSFPIALVLVKQRATAHMLSQMLQEHPCMQQHNLKVVNLVGHGGTGDHGMTVAQQKRTLNDIKSHKYNVVVATSVAEEGVDLPECELVISMNPPSTVTALVQMRGRARKKNSSFVVICSDNKEEEKLEDLHLREKNMIYAANYLVESQNKQHSREVNMVQNNLN